MGTNFYRYPILTKERKAKLHQLIEEERFESNWEHYNDPEDSVKNMIDWLTTGIHICKRSSGWLINFDHNWGKYYEPNRKSLENFLSESDYCIKNEYGEEITPDNFWQMVDDWNSTPNRDGSPKWNSKSYNEWKRENNPEHYHYYPCIDDRNKVYTKWGIKCDSEDFEVDGLRFAVFSDFS